MAFTWCKFESPKYLILQIEKLREKQSKSATTQREMVKLHKELYEML